MPGFRTFPASSAHGGEAIDAKSLGLVLIEYQNEFAHADGKLNGGVKAVMEETGMLEKSAKTAEAVRKAGGKVIHVPISLAEDGSDNPNKNLGILKGCADGKLFTVGSWNAEICEEMKPKGSDLVVSGKRGLDAFPDTDLEEILRKESITTVALGGFLTNCCVESTMRTAFEKGFNVVTLTDCTAAMSPEGQKAACEGTFGLFSQPMSADEFMKVIGS